MSRSSRLLGLGTAVLLLVTPGGLAGADPGQLRPVTPPTAPPPPPPPPLPQTADDGLGDLEDPIYPSSPTGAFSLRAGQFGMRAEIGYPFLELAVSVGLVSWRLQLEAGYRGLYGMTNALYGGLKWTFVASQNRRLGLAIRLIAGYNDVRKVRWDYQLFQNMVGGGHSFGEGALVFSARGQANTAFYFATGLRISEYRPRPCSPGPACVANRKVSYVGYGELGFTTRLGWRTSYFLAVGVDVFAALEDWLPALIRLRTGLAIDF